MDIKDIDTRLTPEELSKLNEVVEYTKTRGNFLDTADKQEILCKRISMLPSVCPCDICKRVRDKNKIESISLPQVMIFKHNDYSDTFLRFVVSPFKHMSNTEFLMSPLWNFVGRLLVAQKNILSYMVGPIDRFNVKMNDLHDAEWVEHACINVTYYKKQQGA